MENGKNLTPIEFAKLGQISVTTVYEWIKKGKIKTIEVKKGLKRNLRIPYSEYERLNK